MFVFYVMMGSSYLKELAYLMMKCLMIVILYLIVNCVILNLRFVSNAIKALLQILTKDA